MCFGRREVCTDIIENRSLRAYLATTSVVSCGHAGVGVNLLDLAVDALDHRLVPVGGLEDFDELLGTNVVRQRPQALAGAAGQQDNIHSVSFQRSARIGLFRKSS